jgi:hypothetical protein
LRNTQSETGMLEEWKEGALVLLRYLPAEEPASTRPRDTGALQDIVECNLAAECHKFTPLANTIAGADPKLSLSGLSRSGHPR